MKKLNVYDVYMDNGRNTFKILIPAPNKKAAEEYVQGNGEVVAIKPATLQDIDLDCLSNTLRREAWGQQEIDLITRALTFCGLDRK